MAYLDHTEHPEERPRPVYCPICRGKLVSRWRPAVTLRRQGVFPYFICVRCDRAVQLKLLPKAPLYKKLYKTRKEARQAAGKIAEKAKTLGKHVFNGKFWPP